MMAATGEIAKTWPVLRYSRREGSTWVRVDDGSGSYHLHAKAGQLMLVQNGTILESLPLVNHTQTHGVVKNDTLLLAARHQSTARKFKIQFTSIQGTQDCVKYLQAFFSIKDVTKPEDTSPVSFGLMFQQLLQNTPAEGIPSPDPIPAEFPLEETLHMCILDPSFCSLVGRVADILQQCDMGRETDN